jgi:heme-degrading monooxygenase HmoA
MMMRVARAKIHRRYTKDFEDLMTKDGLPKIRNLPGNMGGYLARDKRTNEYVFVMLWKDIESIKGLTGEKWQEPAVDPREEKMLAERPTIEHFEVFAEI